MTNQLVGTTVGGKYLIKRLLGAGGMGAVFEGEHVEIGKRVAIKVIAPDHARSPEVAERFRREARAASRVESENITQVFDVGDDPGVGLYMVMEFLGGEDLSVRLAREKKLPAATAIAIGIQAARALAKAHAAGVVHRDLKPANLFLVERDDGAVQVKILDFGISKLVRDEAAPGMSEPPRALTRTGSVIGTPQYMSPEQAQGMAVDLRTDVWSLGAVLYEAISGASAYPDLPTYEQTIIQIVTRQPTPIATLAPEIDPALARLIHEAMTHAVDQRLGDCGAFARRLSELGRAPLRSIPPGPRRLQVTGAASANGNDLGTAAAFKGNGPQIGATGGGVAVSTTRERSPMKTVLGVIVVGAAILSGFVGVRILKHDAQNAAAADVATVSSAAVQGTTPSAIAAPPPIPATAENPSPPPIPSANANVAPRTSAAAAPKSPHAPRPSQPNPAAPKPNEGTQFGAAGLQANY